MPSYPAPKKSSFSSSCMDAPVVPHPSFSFAHILIRTHSSLPLLTLHALSFNFNALLFFCSPLSLSGFSSLPLSLSWHAASDSGRGGSSVQRRQQREQGKEVSAACRSHDEVPVFLSFVFSFSVVGFLPS